jgi:hypothetical protein
MSTEKRHPAVVALEALNVDICRAAGAGMGHETTPAALAAYDRIIVERQNEVRQALARVWSVDIRNHFAEGILSALARAIAEPRTVAPVKVYRHLPDRCPSNHWNDGDDICTDCGTDLNPVDDVAQPFKADHWATLHAAAPDMLEALDTVESWLVEITESSPARALEMRDREHKNRRLLSAIRATTAKARGKVPS